MTFDEVLEKAVAEGAEVFPPAAKEDIEQGQKAMKEKGHPPIPQGYCEFLGKLNGFDWMIPGHENIGFLKMENVIYATGNLAKGTLCEKLKFPQKYVFLGSVSANENYVYNAMNSRYEILKAYHAYVISGFDTFEELFTHAISALLEKLKKYNTERISSADEKVAADGWTYFKYHFEHGGNGLFKARSIDGSELTCIAKPDWGEWSELHHIALKDEFVYFDATLKYSYRNEEEYRFDRYEDKVTYKVKPSGNELAEVTHLKVYLGSSD